MALNTKGNLWDGSALDDDILPPPAHRPAAPATPVPHASPSPAPHLAVAPSAPVGPRPRKHAIPQRFVAANLPVDLIDQVRQRDWGQPLALVVEQTLRDHFDEVVSGITAPGPKPAGQAQWGVRLPLPVFDVLTSARSAAGGATQRAAVESTLRVALRRL